MIRLRVNGRENVPKQGPVLIVANHLSLTDPPIIGATIGRRVAFMAKEELFHNWLGRIFIRAFGAFSVNRGGFNLDSLRQARRVLKEGNALVMFPEGTRSTDIGLLPGFPGSAMLAHGCKVSVIPVGLHGTEKITGLIGFFRRPEVTVNIGRPFILPDDSELTKEKLIEYTEVIMSHIADLLPERYQGRYARTER
jgi:1-acyl-sn-glycerol-3-phosphate acyltransferase